jgi:hypothetical protein
MGNLPWPAVPRSQRTAGRPHALRTTRNRTKPMSSPFRRHKQRVLAIRAGTAASAPGTAPAEPDATTPEAKNMRPCACCSTTTCAR